MVSNMDITQIAEAVKEAGTIALAIHKNPDSDCVGSAAALLIALRRMGKTVHIFADGNIPGRLGFLTENSFFNSDTKKRYDVCLAIDVASEQLMGYVKEEVFDKAKIKCCIDHHGTNPGYADFNYVDGGAAAAGELIYFFIKDFLFQDVTPDIAMRLYAAIASDTGSFQYSNTTPRTHLIASELMATGMDAPMVMRTLFERKTKEQLMLKAEVTNNLKFYADGKICVALVDNEILSKYSMAFEEADDIAALPRSIIGVEVGAYIKVKGEKECKISLRSNEYVDVSAVAKEMGGGGHIRAAGVTLYESPEEAERLIVKALEKVL